MRLSFDAEAFRRDAAMREASAACTPSRRCFLYISARAYAMGVRGLIH